VPTLTYVADPFDAGLAQSLRYESDAVVVMAGGSSPRTGRHVKSAVAAGGTAVTHYPMP